MLAQDHAGHHNDPAAQVHEVLAYDQAFTSVLDFIEKEDTETVMVSTSDHETGGLATARRRFPLYMLMSCLCALDGLRQNLWVILAIH
jgi:alkaline phosphatase